MRYQRVSADELFAAIGVGSESIVRQLVSRDTSAAETRDESGISAIMHCLYRWNLGMLEILLAACPHLDIFEAAALGKVQRLQELLACMPELARSWSGDGVTALHLACFFGHVEAVECLLQAGADPCARASNGLGSTPLQEAARTGQVDVAILLLAHGADPAAANRQGWTALHLAASGGHQRLVEVLLRFAPRSLRTEEGQTARDLALANGHLETARVLDCVASN